MLELKKFPHLLFLKVIQQAKILYPKKFKTGLHPNRAQSRSHVKRKK